MKPDNPELCRTWVRNLPSFVEAQHEFVGARFRVNRIKSRVVCFGILSRFRPTIINISLEFLVGVQESVLRRSMRDK